MPRTTSYTLSDEHDAFIQKKLATGGYASASDVIRTALERFAQEEQKELWLAQALREGEDSDFAEGSHDEVWARVLATLGSR